jgi:hypothetical protein
VFQRLLKTGHGSRTVGAFLRLAIFAAGDDDDRNSFGRVQPVKPFIAVIT